MMIGDEVEQEHFSPHEFVERLAWQTAGRSLAFDDDSKDDKSLLNSSDFSLDETALQLHDSFVASIKDLSGLLEKRREQNRLNEKKTQMSRKQHKSQLVSLSEHHKKLTNTFKSLDSRVNSIANQIVHLGQQIESVDVLKKRNVEALKLMKYFDKFINPSDGVSPTADTLFEQGVTLHEKMSVIQKLDVICGEFSSNPVYESAVTNIDKTYRQIELNMINEFILHHRANNIRGMRDIIEIVDQVSSNVGSGVSRSMPRLVDAFIEQKQMPCFGAALGSLVHRVNSTQQTTENIIFKQIANTCDESWPVIQQIFVRNANEVMSKLILNMYHNKLKAHVESRLKRHIYDIPPPSTTSILGDDHPHRFDDVESYLITLLSLLHETANLNAHLSKYFLTSQKENGERMGNGGAKHGSCWFLSSSSTGSNVFSMLFGAHIDTLYIRAECQFLNEKCGKVIAAKRNSSNSKKEGNQIKTVSSHVDVGKKGQSSSAFMSKASELKKDLHHLISSAKTSTNRGVVATIHEDQNNNSNNKNPFQSNTNNVDGNGMNKREEVEYVYEDDNLMIDEDSLDEEVAISILQLTRKAFDRYSTLHKIINNPTSTGDSSRRTGGKGGQLVAKSPISQIFDILVKYLIEMHVDVVLDRMMVKLKEERKKNVISALKCTSPDVGGHSPVAGPSDGGKGEPRLHLSLLQVIHQVNVIMHLFNKQFNESVIQSSTMSSSSSPSTLLQNKTRSFSSDDWSENEEFELLRKKKKILSTLERKMHIGMDQSLQMIVGHVHSLLNHFQCKSDFNVDEEQITAVSSHQPSSREQSERGLMMSTMACSKVVRFISMQVQQILSTTTTSGNSSSNQPCLDGQNAVRFINELAVRVHRTIYQHLQTYVYTKLGAMSVIADVQEYKKCFTITPSSNSTNGSLANVLFETLHAMCNLLILSPQSLRPAIAQSEHLSALDSTIIQHWVSLRSDYKSKKIFTFL